MSPEIQQKLLEISSLTSRMLRKSFGRGPESCQAYLKYRYLVITIRGFLSPMESILLEHGNVDDIDISRGIVMNNVLAQLRGVLELEFQQDVQDFYHDWNYTRNTGVIMIVFEQDILPGDNFEPFLEQTPLLDEVNRISEMVQKVPDRTEAYQITPSIYLVLRVGILITLEKALIAKGFQQTLLVTKDDLEKGFFHRSGPFQEIFNQRLSDIFIDWNLNDDNSLMCIVLK
ncbi:Na-translocating system protein MpsC family protein [Ammoniphilus sp. CFH 90114]|uniref:Na-translocating system protein MpsC family protein n=1 Tax=Ammoniphilus sp. CFH 90114 TaxID=2493665 RepID=UPI00100F5C1C|nr:Na-translocating system protein MpsC family protein [Ammoniphilus sp. CFH 90114]RXT06535.1 DUF2294 family protein [Ammoniphilus sp. CFH 90114]